MYDESNPYVPSDAVRRIVSLAKFDPAVVIGKGLVYKHTFETLAVEADDKDTITQTLQLLTKPARQVAYYLQLTYKPYEPEQDIREYQLTKAYLVTLDGLVRTALDVENFGLLWDEWVDFCDYKLPEPKDADAFEWGFCNCAQYAGNLVRPCPYTCCTYKSCPFRTGRSGF
jgi:hypothetical protein